MNNELIDILISQLELEKERLTNALEVVIFELDLIKKNKEKENA